MSEQNSLKRQVIFTEEELDLLRTHFKGNQRLAKLMRKVFIDFGSLSEEDKNVIIQTFNKNNPLLQLMGKIYVPTMDLDAPFFGVIDLWATVNINELPEEEANVRIEARDRLINHLKHQLNSLAVMCGLAKPEEEANARIDVWMTGSNAKDRVNVMARNTLIAHVEQMTAIQVWTLAHQEKLSEEELSERIRQNSAE